MDSPCRRTRKSNAAIAATVVPDTTLFGVRLADRSKTECGTEIMLGIAALVSAVSIVLVWVVYPAGMAVLAKLSRSSPARVAADPRSVSVVLATREDFAAIRSRVENLLQSDFDPAKLEIVVAIDPRHADLLVHEVAELDERVRVVRGDEPGGKAATLNAGVRVAIGDVLVFTDTHQRFDPGTIPRLIAALSDPIIGVVSGRLELPPGLAGKRSLVDRYWSYERWLRRAEAQVHSAVGVTGAVYAMRRKLWTPLPPGLILDDVYVPMRVVLSGHRVAFADDARAFETRRTTDSQEYRRKVRTLTGVLQLCVWLPGVLVPFRNPIWLQFLFHKLLRLVTPYWLLAIILWLGAAVWKAADTLPAHLTLLIGAVLLVAMAARPVLLRRVRNVLYQGTLLQFAVVAATFNGLMGRWDVWRK